jgi:predicted dehydrogenase
MLGSGDDANPVPTEPGRYVEFYERMERAIRSGGPPPVPLSAGIQTLRVIEAARASSAERAVVSL